MLSGDDGIAARTMITDAGKTPPPYPKNIEKYLQKYATQLLEGV